MRKYNIGDTYGDFSILSSVEKITNTGRTRYFYVLECKKCKGIKPVRRDLLTKYKGKCKHCGPFTFHITLLYSSLVKDLITVTDDLNPEPKKRNISVTCKCCNITDDLQYKDLVTLGGKYKCKTLNEITSRLGRIRRGIVARCLNKKNPNYEFYGKKGITICEEWIYISNFYQWAIENGYSNDLSIDRIKNKGNYEPGNCRWADAFQQSRNRNNNILDEKLVRKIKNTDWGDKDNFQIADALGFSGNRINMGNAIRSVRTNRTWANVK